MSLPNLTRRFTLEAPVRLPDGAGGFSQSWAALGTLWGEVQSASGREAGGDVSAVSRVSLRITLRAAPQGAPSRPIAGQRLRDGTRLFSILAVTEADASGRYLTCYATEETAT